MRGIAVAGLLLVGTAAAEQREFDAASVEENPSLNNSGTLRFMPGGGITAQNIPARQYITIAFDLQPYQLVNAPDWSSKRPL